VSPVKYELGFYIPEDDILHSHRRENLKSYKSVCPDASDRDFRTSSGVKDTVFWGCDAVWLLLRTDVSEERIVSIIRVTACELAS
jgi:hypothetical protein